MSVASSSEQSWNKCTSHSCHPALCRCNVAYKSQNALCQHLENPLYQLGKANKIHLKQTEQESVQRRAVLFWFIEGHSLYSVNWITLLSPGTTLWYSGKQYKSWSKFLSILQIDIDLLAWNSYFYPFPMVTNLGMVEDEGNRNSGQRKRNPKWWYYLMTVFWLRIPLSSFHPLPTEQLCGFHL